jgi:hypothetical protein
MVHWLVECTEDVVWGQEGIVQTFMGKMGKNEIEGGHVGRKLCA